MINDHDDDDNTTLYVLITDIFVDLCCSVLQISLATLVLIRDQFLARILARKKIVTWNLRYITLGVQRNMVDFVRDNVSRSIDVSRYFCYVYYLISADMRKALVCAINSYEFPYSAIQKLFGDPDDYAYKLDNDTFADALPILEDRSYYIYLYDIFHTMSIDYSNQIVYFSNNVQMQLQKGLFIYDNSTTIRYFPAIPETNQVTVVNVY